MYVFFSPQRYDNKLEYSFDGNHVEVTYNENLKETFDLTDMYKADADGGRRIKESKTLPINPITSVEERNDTLWITVLNFHGANPPHEVAWPEWIEVEDGATYPHPDE